jgi:endonuclease/exonuclease/phosphatase family metal-dependent hydrolase
MRRLSPARKIVASGLGSSYGATAMTKCLSLAAAVLLTAVAVLPAVEFTVMTYNVENLFDLDSRATYQEYRRENYTPEHLRVKVENIASVLRSIDGGKGPDVVVFNEIEIDQTPGSSVEDHREWVESHADQSLAEMLKEPMADSLRLLPAECWLLKACEEAGLKGYEVATAGETRGKYDSGRTRTIQNVVFSRFPIASVLSHETSDARNILEVTLRIDGSPLVLFANHWKSGAGNIDNEQTRISNARVLRDRLDSIFQSNPMADVIVAGDMNSHYNQDARYPDFGTTGIIEVLGSQGNELALQTGRADLYNLWYELPVRERGSDIYRNEWGTLMHMLLGRGLYDNHGIQYVDNSFRVVKIPGVNCDVFGRPRRWSRGSVPGGYSDHFPLLARFRMAPAGEERKWMALRNPSTVDESPGQVVRLVSHQRLFRAAIEPQREPADADFRDGSYDGRVFHIEAPAKVDGRGRVVVEVNGEEYDVFSHEKDVRKKVRDMVRETGVAKFYGELGTYRGRWQFMLHGPEWVTEANHADASSTAAPARVAGLY